MATLTGSVARRSSRVSTARRPGTSPGVCLPTPRPARGHVEEWVSKRRGQDPVLEDIGFIIAQITTKCDPVGEPRAKRLVHGGLNVSTIRRKPRVRPFDGLCHGAIIVHNESQDLVAQVIERGEIPSFEQLAHQNA